MKYNIRDGEILIQNGHQLHLSHRIIYETVLRLQPKITIEVGCGGGDHLANLRLLCPNMTVIGTDISLEQRKFALMRNPDLSDVRYEIRDMTRKDANNGLEGDLVFCQAVIMHIHGGNRHLRFIENMVEASTKYVLFVEDWTRHNFVGAIRTVIPDAMLYLVSRNGKHGILIDKTNSLDYPIIQKQKDLF